MSTMTAVKMPVGEPVALSGGDRAELGQRAWRGLLRAHACLAEASEGRMRMRDLAERAQLSRSGLTRLVDRLEREDLLHRCSCPHDARGAYACLTPRGLARLEEARATHVAVVREHFLSRLSHSEVRAMAEIWERIA